jgi:hypothetical protein
MKQYLACFLAIGVVAAQQNQPTPAGSASSSDEVVPREFLGMTDSATFHGVIDDPDGYVNLREKANASSAIVAKVKKGERFTFQRHEYDPWCKVKLASGKTGWMDAQRILLSFTKADLPEKPEQGDEIDQQARKHGINYYEATQGAVRGDAESLKKFFQVGEFADGAAAEEHAGVLSVVLHLIGDESLAAFLKSQPISVQVAARNSIGDDVTWPFRTTGYLFHHFPKTVKIFYRREITDWPSPDGKYAFHKVFSDEFTDEDSVVTRSELIDKASGKPVLDLKSEDKGAGPYKEGDVEWAPDSKGFLFNTGLTQFGFETKLFVWSDESFKKVDLPLDREPPPDPDPRLAGLPYKGVGSETIHWSKAGTLVCERVYHYEKRIDPDSPFYVEVKYEITMTIGPDGKITTERNKMDVHDPSVSKND